MKLEQLVHVVTVARCESISKAAEQLLMSQPGLSASVKALEQELGTELFLRKNKGVELTQTGSVFVASAKRILGQVDSLEQLCKKASSTVFQTLSVAACHFRCATAAMSMLMKQHKDDGTRYVLRNGVTDACIDWVCKGICDVGIVYYDSNDEKSFAKQMQLKQLHYGNIYQIQAKAMIGQGHPLYDTDVQQIDAGELQKYPLVATDQTVAKDYFRSVFLNNSQENLRVVVTDRSAVIDMLNFSDAYSITLANEITYRNIPRYPGTRELEIRNPVRPITRTVAWIAPFDPATVPLLAQYLTLVTDICTCEDFQSRYPDFITGSTAK